jgi:uncharacterized protein (TIGR04255 family)
MVAAMVVVQRSPLYAPCLRLAVAEVRFPFAPALLDAESLRALATALSPEFPVVRPMMPNGLGWSLSGGVASSDLPGVQVSQQAYRFMSRDMFSSVSIGPTVCVIETTSYDAWETFRVTLERALHVIGEQLAAIAGVDRIGLRYWNEVRLAEPNDEISVEQLTRYLAPEAISVHALSSRLIEYPVVEAQSMTRLESRDGRQVIVRHGFLRGAAVGESPLKLPTPLRSDHYYLVDLDSSATFASAPLEAFDIGRTLALADSLHEPLRRLFDAIVRLDGVPSISGG